MLFSWLRVRTRRPSLRRSSGWRLQVEPLDARICPSFISAPTYPSGPAPVALAVGDFNGDGHADLVTANSSAGTVSVLAGNGDGSFQAHSDVTVGALTLTSLAAGDFNGDGRLDLAVTGQGPTPAGSTTLAPGTVSVLLGNGDGTFQAAQAFTVPRSPAALAVGDFNGDGWPDLAVTAPGATGTATGTASVLLGNGDGSFGAAASYGIGVSPQGVALGDLNGDGRPDLVVANDVNNTSASVSVLLGNGDGSFQAGVAYGVGADPKAVAVADLNGDGRLDLITADAAPRTVSVLLGNGDGSFQPGHDFTTGENPIAVAVADFNGDGRPDLATADNFSNAVSVLPGVGDGTFQVPTVYVGGAGPRAVAAGDFNGDGHADLVTADNGTSTATVYLGKGDGSFPAPRAVDTPPTLVIGGDFNGDGRPDLLEENSGRVLLGNGDGTFQIRTGTGLPRLVSAAVGDFNRDGKLDIAAISGLTNKANVWLGNGDGTFQAPQHLPAGPGAQQSLAVGDFNGDGLPDIAIADAAVPETIIPGGGEIGGSGSVIPGEPPSLNVDLGNGDGSFQAAVSTFPSQFSNTLLVADFNGDGKADVAMISNVASVHLGNGDGTFRKVADYALDNRGTAVAVGDLNGDGRPDLVVTTDSPFPVFAGSVDAFLGNGDGSFQAARISAAGYNPSAVAVADFNQDGIADIAVAHGLTDAVSVQQGNADGTFRPGTSYDAGSDPRALVAADYSGDGFPDLAVGNTDFGGPVTVLRNAADLSALAGATGFRVTAPSAVTAGAPFSVTVTAVDASGNPVPGFLGTVHFTSSDPRASLPSFYTFTAADAGTHTFTGLSLVTAGAETVTAVTPHMASGSAAVTVSPAAAARLAVTTPTSAAAGASFSFAVTALDAYGNTATGYTGSVTFTSSDGQAVLPGAYTFTAADTGNHTFSATLKTAGPQSVTATGAGSAVVGTSPAVVVSPAAAASLALSGFPGATVAGVFQAFTVTALDAYGNVATGYTGRVGFGSSDLQASLPLGGYTFTAADAGRHTFSAALKTAGVQWLGVSDIVTGGPLTVTQTGIVVSPAAAASFTLSGFPAATVAGVVQAFTLTARDAYGNVATGYTGTVNFASSDAQAALPASYTFTAADAGVHTFTAALKTAGTQSLTATDAASAALTVTQSGITVTAAAAASFVVAGFPATTAGVAQTFTVTARDGFGNVATGYTGTVALGSSDGQASLPASYTFTAADAGVHAFTATLKTAGAQSITATDTASAAVKGSQTGILVSAAAVTHFGISAPASATQGKSFTVTVSALDAYGNVVTGYRGKVHFSGTDTKAGLPSDYTFGATDNGVHTFSVTLNTLGLQAVVVTDTTNSTIKGSTAINVVAQTSGGGGGTTSGGGGTGGTSGSGK